MNNSGTAVGWATKHVLGTAKGERAVRWDGSGAGATELDHLGTRGDGFTGSSAYAVNNSGTAVGRASKYVSGVDLGFRAVRWDGSGTTATELDSLGTRSDGFSYSEASDVNDSGTVIGWVAKYDTSGTCVGRRAVRWHGLSTTATELDSLPTLLPARFVTNFPIAVNENGTAVGYAVFGSNDWRAVRWDGSGTSAVELDHLGTLLSGQTSCIPLALNDDGTAVGYASKYVAGTYYGERAVRWDGSRTIVAELDHLGTDSDGYTFSAAYAVNGKGTAVGFAWKYVSGIGYGDRAVRWDGSGTSATELGHLGSYDDDNFSSSALAINDDDTAVGYVSKYVSGFDLDYRAVAWKTDGLAIDLNTLIDPASGWKLQSASGISNTGWITGTGLFDPDGPGGEDAYNRLFVIKIPEPSTFALCCVGLLALVGRVRAGRHAAICCTAASLFLTAGAPPATAKLVFDHIGTPAETNNNGRLASFTSTESAGSYSTAATRFTLLEDAVGDTLATVVWAQGPNGVGQIDWNQVDFFMEVWSVNPGIGPQGNSEHGNVRSDHLAGSSRPISAGSLTTAWGFVAGGTIDTFRIEFDVSDLSFEAGVEYWLAIRTFLNFEGVGRTGAVAFDEIGTVPDCDVWCSNVIDANNPPLDPGPGEGDAADDWMYLCAIGTASLRHWAYALTVTPETLPGDYNGNGTVDAADYTVWRDTLGSTSDPRADGTGDDLVGIPDRDVDPWDYEFWKANFGSTVGSGNSQSTPAAVPEPDALLLVAFGALSLAVRPVGWRLTPRRRTI